MGERKSACSPPGTLQHQCRQPRFRPVPVSSPPSPPQPLPLEATGWRTSRLEASRGYIDAGLGSWLNSTLSFGYTIIDDSDISAGVRFQHNSTSLGNPEIFDGSDVCRQRYDERIGFPLRRPVRCRDSLGRRRIPFRTIQLLRRNPSDGQSIPGNLRRPGTLADAQRCGCPRALGFTGLLIASGGILCGSRRALFRLEPDLYRRCQHIERLRRRGETNISLLAGLDWNYRKSAIGLDVTGNYLIYGKSEDSDCPYNYGAMSFTPWYRLNLDHFRMKLGIGQTLPSTRRRVRQPASLARSRPCRRVRLHQREVPESFSTSWAERSYPRSHRSMNLTITACRDSSTPPAIPSARRRLRFPSRFIRRLRGLGRYRFPRIAQRAYRRLVHGVSLPSATAPAMFGGAYDGVMPALSDMLYDNMAHLFRIQRGPASRLRCGAAIQNIGRRTLSAAGWRIRILQRIRPPAMDAPCRSGDQSPGDA